MWRRERREIEMTCTRQYADELLDRASLTWLEPHKTEIQHPISNQVGLETRVFSALVGSIGRTRLARVGSSLQGSVLILDYPHTLFGSPGNWHLSAFRECSSQQSNAFVSNYALEAITWFLIFIVSIPDEKYNVFNCLCARTGRYISRWCWRCGGKESQSMHGSSRGHESYVVFQFQRFFATPVFLVLALFRFSGRSKGVELSECRDKLKLERRARKRRYTVGNDRTKTLRRTLARQARRSRSYLGRIKFRITRSETWSCLDFFESLKCADFQKQSTKAGEVSIQKHSRDMGNILNDD